jgi:carotenoid cleavage dioxygenase-like enzyme
MARRYELATGELSTFHFGESAAISETIFVPKSPQSAKSDGYLLLTVFDERRNASYLAILDAMHIEGGPIAKVHVDHRVPIGFHGVWRTATVLIYRLGGTSAKGVLKFVAAVRSTGSCTVQTISTDSRY